MLGSNAWKLNMSEFGAFYKQFWTSAHQNIQNSSSKELQIVEKKCLDARSERPVNSRNIQY